VKQWTPWLVCAFVPFIVVDLQLAIYCDPPRYKARAFDTEELLMDRKKKQLSEQLIFDDSVKRLWVIRYYLRGLGTLSVLSIRVYTCILVT